MKGSYVARMGWDGGGCFFLILFWFLFLLGFVGFRFHTKVTLWGEGLAGPGGGMGCSRPV